MNNRRTSTTSSTAAVSRLTLPAASSTNNITGEITTSRKNSAQAGCALPSWLVPYCEIVQHYVDFGKNSQAAITFKSGRKHSVSDFALGEMQCQMEKRRLARRWARRNPDLKEKLMKDLDNVLETRDGDMDKLRGWIGPKDPLTPASNGTIIRFGLFKAGNQLIHGWDFTSVYFMSQTNGRYAVLRDGQIRQEVWWRLRSIPVFTAQDTVNVRQWLHNKVKWQFKDSGDSSAVYTHHDGQQIKLQGGWTSEAMRRACEEQWQYVLMTDGTLRQAPRIGVYELPMTKYGEEALQHLKRRNINECSVDKSGTVLFSRQTNREQTKIAALSYQDVLKCCRDPGKFVLTREGHVRRYRS